jgi:hypothetical protein
LSRASEIYLRDLKEVTSARKVRVIVLYPLKIFAPFVHSSIVLAICGIGKLALQKLD